MEKSVIGFVLASQSSIENKLIIFQMKIFTCIIGHFFPLDTPALKNIGLEL